MIELLFAAAALFEIEQIQVAPVGEVHAISWCNSTGQNTPEFTHTIEVLEFPPKIDQLPVASHEAVGPATPWQYEPRKAGMYWIRGRTCHTVEGCSPWLGTVDVPPEIPGCVTNPLRKIYFFQLPAPTEGGID
ncbi:MAG: hypothetical protein ACR2PR_03280 [Pseudohongiellaceae bacterium]